MPSEIKGSSNFDSDSAGKVLQVVSTTKTDTYTSSSTSWNDITGLSVSITPSSTSSKIMVLLNVQTGNTGGTYHTMTKLLRGSTDISVGDAAGSRTRGSTFYGDSYISSLYSSATSYLDSPTTTSATTYKVQIRASGNTATVNRGGRDTDNSAHIRTASSITVMEIGA